MLTVGKILTFQTAEENASGSGRRASPLSPTPHKNKEFPEEQSDENMTLLVYTV